MSTVEMLNRAMQFHQDGRLPEAEQLYRQVIETEPRCPEAWCYLGTLYAGEDRLEEAAAHFMEALRLKPSYAEAQNNLGVVLARRGRISEAISSYRQAIKLKPHDAVTYNNLGLALASQGEYAEASLCYQQAMRLQPDYAEARRNYEAIRQQPEIVPTETLVEVPGWMRPTLKQLDVSIIIPMFRAREVIGRQIKQWDLSDDGIFKELVYVDNSCPDGSAEAVIEAWTRRHDAFVANGLHTIKIIKLKPNYSFPGAVNIGAKHASCQDLIFLNADTVVTPNWVEPLLTTLHSDPKMGIVGNLILRPDDTIDSAGAEWLWHYGNFFHIGLVVYQGQKLARPMRVHEAPPDVLQAGEREMVTGCCCALTRKVFEEVGGWPMGYRLGYYDDTELNLEVRSRGYKVYFEPRSVIYHWHGHSGLTSHPFVRENAKRFHDRWVSNYRIDSLVKAKRPPGINYHF